MSTTTGNVWYDDLEMTMALVSRLISTVPGFWLSQFFLWSPIPLVYFPAMVPSYFSGGFRVVHRAFIRMVKFQFLAQLPVDHLPYTVVSTLILLLYSLIMWLFHFNHPITHICYFVAAYLFLLWYSWSLWGCFVILLLQLLLLLQIFFTSATFQLKLSDSKSPHLSRTLPSILSYLNNSIISISWFVLRFANSNSPFHWKVPSTCLSFRFQWFKLCFTGMAKSTEQKIFFPL